MSRCAYKLQPKARRDLDLHTDYLLAEAGSEIAFRFVEMARKSFTVLAETPGIGPAISSPRPELSGMRKWQVEHFPKILIFYVPTTNGATVVRLLHASQDWQTLLNIG